MVMLGAGTKGEWGRAPLSVPPLWGGGRQSGVSRLCPASAALAGLPVRGRQLLRGAPQLGSALPAAAASARQRRTGAGTPLSSPSRCGFCRAWLVGLLHEPELSSACLSLLRGNLCQESSRERRLASPVVACNQQRAGRSAAPSETEPGGAPRASAREPRCTRPRSLATRGASSCPSTTL